MGIYLLNQTLFGGVVSWAKMSCHMWLNRVPLWQVNTTAVPSPPAGSRIQSWQSRHKLTEPLVKFLYLLQCQVTVTVKYTSDSGLCCCFPFYMCDSYQVLLIPIAYWSVWKTKQKQSLSIISSSYYYKFVMNLSASQLVHPTAFWKEFFVFVFWLVR